MNLIYRGQSYTLSHKVKLPNTQTSFTYRGRSYQHRLSVASVTPKAKLTYRGVSYIHAESSLPGNLNPTFN